jgi:hypothetical protein
MLQSFMIIAKNTNYIKNGNKSIQKNERSFYFSQSRHTWSNRGKMESSSFRIILFRE